MRSYRIKQLRAGIMRFYFEKSVRNAIWNNRSDLTLFLKIKTILR